MGTVRAIHLYTAIVFTLAVLVRIYWMFAGNRYARLAEFIPLSRRRLRSLWETFLYYSFLRRHPDVYQGHNALAGATYGLVFAIYLVMIATGLALYTVYAPVNSPFQVFRLLVPFFYGLQMARLIHHIGMWVVLIFAVVHIYSAVPFVDHRTFRNIGLDLFRLQILAQAESRRLVSDEPAPQAATKTIGVLVLGLGNVLLGDDGVGAAAVARIERDYRVPPGVRLEDGGTLGLSLLDLLAESDHVILVDAVRADGAAGNAGSARRSRGHRRGTRSPVAPPGRSCGSA